MLAPAPAEVNPRIEFEKRYAFQSLEAAIARGDGTIICRGGRGCGKTLGICWLLHYLACVHAGIRQVWLRWERSKMTETVLQTYEDEILGIGHPMRSGRSREGRNGYEYPNGSRIILMGISDDIDATKSLQADIIYVNECGQVPWNIWDEIGAAARERVGISPSGFKRLKIGDLNPMPPGHWTNAMAAEFPRKLYPRVLDDGTNLPRDFPPSQYMDAQRYNIAPLDKSRHKHKLIQWFPPDNPGYWDFNAWEWLPPGLEYVQNRLGIMGANRKARYLEGRPVAVEDVVFPEFDRELHVIPPFDWPAEWPVWVAYDPGFRHPCAVDFVGISPTGQPFFIDEIHASEIPALKLGPEIQRKSARYRCVRWLDDPFGANQKTQTSDGLSARDYMRTRFALHFQPWKEAKGPAKNAAVEELRTWLIQSEPLQVFDTCPGIISNFESWKNKVNKTGEMPDGDERYEDRDNDGLDGLMGIVADRPTFTPPVCEVYNDGE